MSAANTIGSFTGNVGAYAKHAVLSTGLHSTAFARNYAEATSAQYAAKDTQLAARRAELSAARTAVAAIPSRKPRQTKLAA